ncbi:MAG: ArsC family reductase [Methylotenera sp.]|uniref:ArsC family reductase n=1 Tax=Methylotenera sp. TaxID=2051956 RepID=UPI0017A31A9E|nr:ArsC family reductase [Methylotenera sp.]NOU24797.1 ArsC family reductase [Methylotenera sp.]
MLTLYGIPNCNTVKKARDWLEANDIRHVFHDFKKNGIDAATIEHWLKQYPWEKLINRAGLTWRGLDDTTKISITDNITASELMQDKTSVIKRPILVSNGKIIGLGFDENLYKETFKP